MTLRWCRQPSYIPIHTGCPVWIDLTQSGANIITIDLVIFVFGCFLVIKGFLVFISCYVGLGKPTWTSFELLTLLRQEAPKHQENSFQKCLIFHPQVQIQRTPCSHCMLPTALPSSVSAGNIVTTWYFNQSAAPVAGVSAPCSTLLDLTYPGYRVSGSITRL